MSSSSSTGNICLGTIRRVLRRDCLPSCLPTILAFGHHLVVELKRRFYIYLAEGVSIAKGHNADETVDMSPQIPAE